MAYMRLNNMTLKYRRHVLLNGAFAEFPQGEITHVLGRNGCGKSSLAKAIAGIVPYQGHIEEIQYPITLIGSYSSIPPNVHVRDVMSYAYGHYDASIFHLLYERLHLKSVPEGASFSKLSDGQKQKIKLLYFLSDAPRTVILDEATSALDRKSAHEITLFLHRYAGMTDATIIDITHDIANLLSADTNFILFEHRSLNRESSAENAVKRYVRGI